MATERKAQFIREVSTVQQVSYRPLVQCSEAPTLTSVQQQMQMEYFAVQQPIAASQPLPITSTDELCTQRRARKMQSSFRPLKLTAPYQSTPQSSFLVQQVIQYSCVTECHETFLYSWMSLVSG